MEENTYCVYMHTLKTDGRKYIGITCKKNPNYRWANGKGYHNNEYFTNVINKYGWDAFKHEVLFNDLTKEQACVKEQALIKLFHTTEHDFGFNLTTGGEHYECTEEIKQKISERTKLAMQKLSSEKKANMSRRGCIPWNKKEKPDKETLQNDYIICNKSLKKCADIYNVSTSLIYNWLVDYKLYTSMYTNLKIYRKLRDEEVTALEYFYTEEQYSIKNLCILFGWTNKELFFYLKFYNILKKNTTKRFKIKEAKNKDSNNTKIVAIEIPYKELYYQYIELDKTQKQCAEYFNCCLSTIQKLLISSNIRKDHIIRRKKLVLDREKLYNYYVTKNYSIMQCAECLNTTYTIIEQNLRDYKIYKPNKFELSPEQIQSLYEYYCIMGYSQTKCAKIFNVCGPTMKKILRKYNIIGGNA